MIDKKTFLIIGFILFIPWIYIFFSVYAQKIGLEDFIPPNKCIEIAKIQFNSEDMYSSGKDKKMYTDILDFSLEDIPDVNTLFLNGEEEENIKPVRNILVVGDSIGEGLYLSYLKSIKNRFDCVNFKFYVKQSTTTFYWLKNKRFLKDISSNRYDVAIISLGANEWNTDTVSLFYHIRKFYLKIKELCPNTDIYWVIPNVKSRFLREYIEKSVGKENCIAIEDFKGYIPLSKDRVHLDMRKHGYKKLWDIIIHKINSYRYLSCKR